MSERRAQAVIFPNTVSTGASVSTVGIREVVMAFAFGDFVGVVMPQADYGLGLVDVLASGVSASCAVPIPGRPYAVAAKTTTATSGSTQTANVSGSAAR